MRDVDETHEPGLKSWLASANESPDFPIQNLPFCVFRPGQSDSPRGGVGIGDQIVDLAALAQAGIVQGSAGEALHAASGASLNALMAMGPDASGLLRQTLSRLLRADAAEESVVAGCLVPQSAAVFSVPANIGDYTDFYTSIHHATNIGRLFRPDNPLLPNYRWVPIGYHGRASSIVVSGTDFHRPLGQTKAADADSPSLGPSQRLDYELEVGIYVGQGNNLGEPVPIAAAEDHIFGVCLLNDWSARDIQAWEYQPLGPFLAKSFATTVAPWIVTLEALAPFRQSWTRPDTDPQPLAYLDSAANRTSGAIDAALEVLIETAQMRGAGEAPVRLSLSNFTDSYWTVAQMLSHHTVNGCNLAAGDLFGSGTMSGADERSQAALIELTTGGAKPIHLPNGETRSFLEDGDRVILRGWCDREGARRIGFGEASGTVLAPYTERR